MPFFRYLLLLLCLGLLAASGCVRQPIDAAGLEVLRQGQLEEPEGDVDIAPVVYVNVRDNTNRVFGLRAQTESWQEYPAPAAHHSAFLALKRQVRAPVHQQSISRAVNFSPVWASNIPWIKPSS
jgi:hypothetical protein